ncbi:MAG: hypothetical protein ACHQQR_13065 [Gemmatimonadales bacterium]
MRELDEVIRVRARRRRLILACLVAAVRTLPAQQEVPPDKARLADAVRADLSRLSDLERAYLAVNKRFTVDIKALQFKPASGAAIAVSYASARTFSASASDIRLAPFLCFVILSSAGAGSPAEKPFCTDSRYGTAASALARDAAAPEPSAAPAPRLPSNPSPAVEVTPVTVGGAERTAAKPAELATGPATITATAFEERLRAAASAKRDSIIVIVQFAVKDARYDPSRGVLEVAVERVPMPLAPSQAADTGSARPALACFTRPAFVCGISGLTYIARDLLRVPRSRAPDPEVLRSGLTLQARFAIGRRDDTPGPALTLLALVLRAKGEVVSSWEAAGMH